MKTGITYMNKCGYCGLNCPETSKFCARCGYEFSSNPAANIRVRWGPLEKIILASLACAVVVLWAISIARPVDPLPPGTLSGSSYRSSGDQAEATVMAEKFVKRYLISPGSAQFSSYSETTASYLGEQRWRVSGWVDSQNKFGALLRNNYICTMVYEGNSRWKPENVEILER